MKSTEEFIDEMHDEIEYNQIIQQYTEFTSPEFSVRECIEEHGVWDFRDILIDMNYCFDYILTQTEEDSILLLGVILDSIREIVKREDVCVLDFIGVCNLSIHDMIFNTIPMQDEGDNLEYDDSFNVIGYKGDSRN